MRDLISLPSLMEMRVIPWSLSWDLASSRDEALREAWTMSPDLDWPL